MRRKPIRTPKKQKPVKAKRPEPTTTKKPKATPAPEPAFRPDSRVKYGSRSLDHGTLGAASAGRHLSAQEIAALLPDLQSRGLLDPVPPSQRRSTAHVFRPAR